MTDLMKGRGLARLLSALCLGAVVASATIVPPERLASALRAKAGAEVTEECKQPPAKTASKSAEPVRETPEIKKSTESGHPQPDLIKHLLRGILL
jgi:hypothetical protein